MNNILFDTKQLDNRMGTKRLNCLGTNHLSWVQIVCGYETTGKPFVTAYNMLCAC